MRIKSSLSTGVKISQQGTHDELIKQAGIYADFVGMREKAIGWKIKADSLA